MKASTDKNNTPKGSTNEGTNQGNKAPANGKKETPQAEETNKKDGQKEAPETTRTKMNVEKEPSDRKHAK